AAAFRLVKPLVHRAAEMLRGTLVDRHLPPELRVVSDAPNLDAGVPPWLAAAGNQLAAKIEEWVSRHVAGYLEHSGEACRRLSAENRHGLTFRLTMTRIPGIEKLRLAAQGRDVNAIQGAAWLDGTPAIVMHIRPGHAIR